MGDLAAGSVRIGGVGVSGRQLRMEVARRVNDCVVSGRVGDCLGRCRNLTSLTLPITGSTYSVFSKRSQACRR